MAFSFGATTSAPASGGFSFNSGANASTTTSQAGTGGGFSFGGGNSTPAASSGFGFGFGGNTASTANTSTGSSAFVTPTPTRSTGFGFGASTSQPASSGFGFGASTSQTSSSGFGFGASTSQPASSGFGFGTNTTQPASSGFGFGATTNQPASTGFGFGAAPNTGSSLFGGNNTQQTNTGFGGFNTQQQTGTGFGFSNNQQLAAPKPQITLDTTFESLPDDVKRNVIEFHKYLKEADQSDTLLRSASSEPLHKLRENMDDLEQQVLRRRNASDRQQASVHAVRKDVKHLLKVVDSASLTTRTLDGTATSQLYNIMRKVEQPSSYYWDLLDQYEARMLSIKGQIESIEAQLTPLSATSLHPTRLQDIMKSQNAALLQAAAKIAQVHEEAEELRAAFLKRMKSELEKSGDANAAKLMKNPFDRRKKGPQSEEDIRHAIDKIRFRTNVAPKIANSTPQPAPTGTPALTNGAAPASSFSFQSQTPNATSAFGATTPAASSAASSAAPSSGFGFGASSTTPSTNSLTFATTTTSQPGATSSFVNSSFMAGDKRTAETSQESNKRPNGRKKRL